MHYCYIIYSQILNKYYIGESRDVQVRIEQHNKGFFKTAYTRNATDWSLFLIIPCSNIVIARKLEKFIKLQKSRKFIEQLKLRPEIIPDILLKII